MGIHVIAVTKDFSTGVLIKGLGLGIPYALQKQLEPAAGESNTNLQISIPYDMQV